MSPPCRSWSWNMLPPRREMTHLDISIQDKTCLRWITIIVCFPTFPVSNLCSFWELHHECSFKHGLKKQFLPPIFATLVSQKHPKTASPMAWGLRVLLSSAVAYAADLSFASWESHGELMDKEALKEKATSQDRDEIKTWRKSFETVSRISWKLSNKIYYAIVPYRITYLTMIFLKRIGKTQTMRSHAEPYLQGADWCSEFCWHLGGRWKSAFCWCHFGWG